MDACILIKVKGVNENNIILLQTGFVLWYVIETETGSGESGREEGRE